MSVSQPQRAANLDAIINNVEAQLVKLSQHEKPFYTLSDGTQVSALQYQMDMLKYRAELKKQRQDEDNPFFRRIYPRRTLFGRGRIF